MSATRMYTKYSFVAREPGAGHSASSDAPEKVSKRIVAHQSTPPRAASYGLRLSQAFAFCPFFQEAIGFKIRILQTPGLRDVGVP